MMYTRQNKDITGIMKVLAKKEIGGIGKQENRCIKNLKNRYKSKKRYSLRKVTGLKKAYYDC